MDATEQSEHNKHYDKQYNVRRTWCAQNTEDNSVMRYSHFFMKYNTRQEDVGSVELFLFTICLTQHHCWSVFSVSSNFINWNIYLFPKPNTIQNTRLLFKNWCDQNRMDSSKYGEIEINAKFNIDKENSTKLLLSLSDRSYIDSAAIENK